MNNNFNNNSINVESQYRTLMTLWVAMLFSQFTFLIVLFFAKPTLFRFDFSKPLLDGENSALIIALAIAGIVCFALSFVFRRKFINRGIANQNVSIIQQALIISCAFCEAVSIFGLVVAFSTNYQYFFLWSALGIPGIILGFPKRENLIAASYKRQ